MHRHQTYFPDIRIVTHGLDRSRLKHSSLYTLLQSAITAKKRIPHRYIYSFGYNRFGQLGTGDTQTRETPRLMEELCDMSVIEVVGGWHRTLALTASGKVFCCGSNDVGDVGIGSYEQVVTQLSQIMSFKGHKVIKVASSRCCHSLALTEDGEVWSWGSNKYGQLGTGDYELFSSTPVEIIDLRVETISDIFAGGDAKRGFSFAITESGECYGWGLNSNSQLGLGHNDNVSTPCLLSSLPPLKTMALGNNHVIAVTTDDRVFSWGSNLHGQLGTDEMGSYEDPPREILSLRGVGIRSVVCGDQFSLGLSRDGRVFSWGIGGPLGHGDYEYRTFPKQIMTLCDKRIIKLGVGYFRVMALTDENRIYAWGSNKYCMSGFSVEEAYVDTPQEVSTLSPYNVTDIAVGSHHTFILSNNELC
jgi:E3 ubiquitin-protein ligase HERC4